MHRWKSSFQDRTDAGGSYASTSQAIPPPSPLRNNVVAPSHQWPAPSSGASNIQPTAPVITFPTSTYAAGGEGRTQEHDTYYVSDTSPFNAPYSVIADATEHIGDSGTVTRANSPQETFRQRTPKRRRLTSKQGDSSVYANVVTRGEMSEASARSRFRL